MICRGGEHPAPSALLRSWLLLSRSRGLGRVAATPRGVSGRFRGRVAAAPRMPRGSSVGDAGQNQRSSHLERRRRAVRAASRRRRGALAAPAQGRRGRARCSGTEPRRPRSRARSLPQAGPPLRSIRPRTRRDASPRRRRVDPPRRRALKVCGHLRLRLFDDLGRLGASAAHFGPAAAARGVRSAAATRVRPDRSKERLGGTIRDDKASQARLRLKLGADVPAARDDAVPLRGARSGARCGGGRDQAIARGGAAIGRRVSAHALGWSARPRQKSDEVVAPPRRGRVAAAARSRRRRGAMATDSRGCRPASAARSRRGSRATPMQIASVKRTLAGIASSR